MHCFLSFRWYASFRHVVRSELSSMVRPPPTWLQHVYAALWYTLMVVASLYRCATIGIAHMACMGREHTPLVLIIIGTWRDYQALSLRQPLNGSVQR
jgi:predicted deacetylase